MDIKKISVENKKERFMPGPWEVSDDKMFIVAERKNFMYPPKCICCSPTPSEWSMANARLIAAAPEMLEALNFIVNCFEPGENAVLDSKGYNLACQAIHKALGE